MYKIIIKQKHILTSTGNFIYSITMSDSKIRKWLQENLREDDYDIHFYDHLGNEWDPNFIGRLEMKNEEDINLLRLIFGHKYIIEHKEV